MEQTQYAGFWKRFAAFVIDYSIVAMVGYVIFYVFTQDARLAQDTAAAGFEAETVARIGAIFIEVMDVLLIWLYYAAFESSRFQATPGSMALGLQVTNNSLGRLTFARASGRFFASILSLIAFGIGYLMIAFTKKKQGLHDIIAKTLVVEKRNF